MNLGSVLYFFCYVLAYHGASSRSVTARGLGTYTLHENKKTYKDAVQQCRSEGGYLAVINSNAEEDVLIDLLKKSYADNALIGVTDIAIEGFMVTELGDMWSSVGYSKWQKDEPNDARREEDCVIIKEDRFLYDTSCAELENFFCERPATGTSSIQGNAVGATISDGYVTVPRVGTYRLYSQPAPYSEAAQVCANDDAHLVVINSKEEEDVVVNLMDGSMRYNIFVGINDLASEGHMVTITGEPLTAAFLKWNVATKEPNNADGVEHCGCFGNNRLMNDEICGKRFSFVCEKFTKTASKTAHTGGYVTVPGLGSYILHEYKLSYKLAAQVCENEDAQLAVINSKQEEDFLMKLLLGGFLSTAYVGVNDLDSEGNMTTSLGETWSKVGYSSWAPGEPNNANNNEDCVVIGRNRRLQDVQCALKMAYFCEKSTPDVLSLRRENAGQFSDSPYINVANVGSYKLHLELKSFYDATQACLSEGAHLAIINSKEEEDALVNLFQGTRRSEAFIGVNDIAVEGRFMTVFNEPYLRNGFYKWAAGEPRDVSGLEDCVIFGKDRSVRVQRCGHRTGFLCEKANGCPGFPVDPSLVMECVLNREEVDCSETAMPGTMVTMSCAQGYTHGSSMRFFSANCQSNNTWSDPVIRCDRDCGKINVPRGQEYISRGHSVRAGALPWHVGIFKQNNGTYDHQCGGTLIAPHLVVTAAHCFWNTGTQSPFDKTLFRIAAGQISISYEKPETGTQTRAVEELIIPDQYTGHVNFFQSDIVIVRLSHRLEITRTVDIICVDWRNELPATTEGENGTVAGWGFNENMTLSENLMAVQLAYVPYKRCWDMFKKNRDFRPYITSDKMCAGWTGRGTSVCPGDSGGGLVFPEVTKLGTRYFLRGIVSVGPAAPIGKCNVDNLATFTDIATHLPFLTRHVKL